MLLMLRLAVRPFPPGQAQKLYQPRYAAGQAIAQVIIGPTFR